VWVAFNFDWAPVTGVFWLLAGTLWSAASPAPAPRRAADQVPVWRAALAVGLAALAVVLGLFPVLADVVYRQGRADVAVSLDPLQAQYQWGLGTIQGMQRAADLGESEPSLFIALGDAWQQAGDPAAAERAYRHALQIDPYYTPAFDRLTEMRKGP
jgi:hypothetical protein